MLFLTSITSTHAACTQEEINNFKKIEDEYTVKYEFNNTNKTYNIYFNSKQSDKYYYQIYSEKELECSIVNDTTVKCINFPPGKYDIDIKGVTNTCKDVLKEMTLNLPEYNKYSEDPLCEGIEEFVLCSPTYNKEIDYDTFVSRVNTYKRTKKEKQNEETEQKVEVEEKNEFLEKTVNYIKDNLVTIIIAVFIVLLIITIVTIAKSIRKSRRLE